MAWDVLMETLSTPMPLGIILGLFVGKQIGIFFATWLFLPCGLVDMPAGLELKHIYGGAVLCGIGFTMSLFLADLSFDIPPVRETAKMSILIASVLCGLVGLGMLTIGRPTLPLSRKHSEPHGDSRQS